jgi:hypothetical protein
MMEFSLNQLGSHLDALTDHLPSSALLYTLLVPAGHSGPYVRLLR